MMADMNKIKKLPKWAQDEIIMLKRKHENLSERFSEITQQVDADNIENLRWYFDIPLETRCAIPEHSRIHINTKNGQFYLIVRDEVLEIYAKNHQLNIIPNAANCIGLTERR